MHAPAKPDIAHITPEKLEQYDAVLFGIPTRYGNFPAQFKTFWYVSHGDASTTLAGLYFSNRLMYKKERPDCFYLGMLLAVSGRMDRTGANTPGSLCPLPLWVVARSLPA